MTPRDKDLEDRIEEVGNKLTTPPSDVQQLLQLLDKSENFLSRVEQCPPQSMHAALQPSMKALVTRDLLRHSDLDVRISVASCLSEITRITAPDAPYDDDIMKEIFGLIVGAFKNLDEMSSQSFSKRVSILETVAKVRSCVLMLDLECDDLILDMFHHFLKTIRPKHSDTVFSSMETVMSLVIEESETISAKLLSCLLDNLKIDEKNIIPSAKKLAEKVLSNCALKLKPFLVEAFKGNCAPLSDYNKIVAAVCQGNHGTLMPNDMNNFGETQADDSKLSDRTLCDGLPQGSAKQEHEVLLGKAAGDADGPSKLVMSNGTIQMGNGDSMTSEQKAEFSQSAVQLKDIDGSRLGDSDNVGLGAAKLDSGNLNSRKGRKRKALVKLAVNNDHKQIDDEKEAPAITGRRKGRSKEADLTQVDGYSFKEAEAAVSSKPRKKNKLEPTPGLADVSSSVSLHTPNKHDVILSKKGPPSRSKKPSGKRNATDKAAVDGPSSASGHGGLLENSQTTSGDFPTREPNSKKSEVISESERNLSKNSASKSHKYVEDSKTTPAATCDSETKHQRHRGRSGSQREVKKVDFSGQKHSAGTKQQEKGGLHVDEEDKEVKLKELVSSRKSAMKESITDPSLLKDINESKSRRKHSGATQETTGTPKRRKSNEKLIDAKIRVWWPDDERFYDGVVDSFDRSTKKHKILYNDGDVEFLLLKNEIWEFIEAETKTGGENASSDINASDVKNKKSKGRRGHASVSDKTETVLPMISPDSTIKTESNDKSPKRKGRPPVKVPDDEDPKKSSKGRAKSTNRHPDKSQKDNNQPTETTNKLDSEKPAQNSKADSSKSSEKVDNDKSSKSRRKSKGDSSRSTVKSEDASLKSRKKSKPVDDSGIKSKDEDSLKTKSSIEGRRKTGGRPVEGSSQKARGRSTGRIYRNLNANETPKSDRPKVEDAEAKSTTGKKRKRGRLGR